jgi:DNA repair exonuclease SbcCD ATPase subunit
MEVKKFQDSRNAELASFQKQYAFLKGEYSKTLESALREPDAAEQQSLISRIQQINSQLTEELHAILSKLNQGSAGFDPKEMNQLTADLIQYQKDYAEIEKSKDRVNTLKKIYATTSDNLNSATFMYYLYIAILLVLCFYVSYLVLKTSWSKGFFSTASTVPTQ